MKKKHLLTHMSIKTRFILTFTAILTASVIAMLFITDFLYFRIVENKATELAQQYINQSALEVENSVDIIENIANIVVNIPKFKLDLNVIIITMVINVSSK